jgi:cytidine deaminase
MRHNKFQQYVDYLTKKRRSQNNAIRFKKYSNRYQSHICAILDKKSGTIIGIGSNSYHPQNKAMYGTIHAEVNALTKHKHKLGRNKVNLLVIRVNGGNSKPCSDCISNISNYFPNVNRVYYSNIKDEVHGLSYDNVNQLKSDPEMHVSSYFSNKGSNHIHNSCTCDDGCDSGDSGDSGDDSCDSDDDDDEAKESKSGKKPAL